MELFILGVNIKYASFLRQKSSFKTIKLIKITLLKSLIDIKFAKKMLIGINNVKCYKTKLTNLTKF